MSVTVDDLARHLGFATTPTDTDALQRALDAAHGVIRPYLDGDVGVWTPEQVGVMDSAVLTVAQDLWRRKDAAGGGGEFGFTDGSDYPFPIPRDPITPVWAMLGESGLVNPRPVA